MKTLSPSEPPVSVDPTAPLTVKSQSPIDVQMVVFWALHHIVQWDCPDILKEHAASTFRVTEFGSDTEA